MNFDVRKVRDELSTPVGVLTDLITVQLSGDVLATSVPVLSAPPGEAVGREHQTLLHIRV